MKLLIASDIHGAAYYANQIKKINESEQPDQIILLGDIYYHGPRNPLTREYNPMEVAKILNSMKDKLRVVKGNCDSEVDQMISEFTFEDQIQMEVDGTKIFFTHGHIYNINNPPKDDYDMLIYGHYHVDMLTEKEGKIYANPGSISLPKQGSKHSYFIFENKQLVLKEIE